MGKPYIQLLGFFLLFAVAGFSQRIESVPNEGFNSIDSTIRPGGISEKKIIEYIHTRDIGDDVGIVGGYVESIFHESIDSANVEVIIDGHREKELTALDGLFYFGHSSPGKLIDIKITHPDYHTYDTAFIIPDEKYAIHFFQLIPKYKILLRGRAFAGKIPLEDVDVNILFENKNYNLKTKGCYYDDEDYWNCLFDGMFKQDLTADDAGDSIYISLSKMGMKPLNYNMKFNEYTGEIMHFKMKYTSELPYVPLNSVNLKLGFPFFSSGGDWFVSLSYYRLLNKDRLRRFGLGLDGNMFLSTITVSHSTLPGLDVTSYDSTYIFSFIGPSALIWITRPERRYFSTYAGCTFAFMMGKGSFVAQPFIGSRIFLDYNKAISFDFRYSEFSYGITYYQFNLYGNANKYKVTETYKKINFILGLQVVF